MAITWENDELTYLTRKKSIWDIIKDAFEYDSLNFFIMGIDNIPLINPYTYERDVYLWQDINGNIYCSFNLLDQGFKSTPAKLNNILTRHFQCYTEVVNSYNEVLKKQYAATTAYTTTLAETLKKSTDVQNNQQAKNLAPHQQVFQKSIQQQLHQQKQSLLRNQLQITDKTFYIYIATLPLIHKEEFSPERKQIFYLQNGMYYKNRYLPSVYMQNTLPNIDLQQYDSFILSFIIAMTKNDETKVIHFFIWLVNSYQSLRKLPHVLVLHSQEDIYMKLLYEEIIEPIFNSKFCAKIDSDNLNKKALTDILHEKVIYNFHNITTNTILNAPAKELTKRLMYKDKYKIDSNAITTKANILITSTSNYIPLLTKDVPSIFIEIASNLNGFCKKRAIIEDPYIVAKLIKEDLPFFTRILNGINLNKLNSRQEINFNNSIQSTNVIDGDVDALKAFVISIKNKDLNFFKEIEIKSPKLYTKLVDDLNKQRIDRKNLIEYFSILFGKDIYKTNRMLIAKLKEMSSTEEAFDNKNTFNNNGRVYYKI